MAVDKKILLLLLLFILFLPNISLANTLDDAFGVNSPLDTIAQDSGYNIAPNETNVNTLVGTIIQTLLSIIGVFFLVLMIYGGFLWMTDRGNSDQVEKAKKLITAAIIGVIIVFASYAISFFVIKTISTPTLEEVSS